MKKFKPSAVSVLIGIVLLGGIYLLSRPGGASPAPAQGGPLSQLEVAENEFDFGSISMRQGQVAHAFRLKNTGVEPVVIAKVYTSCMCTEASLQTAEGEIGPFGMAGHGLIPRINRAIAPGEEATLYAVFDPAAHGPAGVGRVSRVITLEGDGSAPLVIGFRANVTP